MFLKPYRVIVVLIYYIVNTCQNWLLIDNRIQYINERSKYKVSSSVNDQYLDATIKCLSVLMEQKIELADFKGKDAYLFSCPFCTQFVRSEKSRQKRTARLMRVGYRWEFTCSRGFSCDCRGGSRSFHNFLLLLNPQLFKEYQISLGMLDERNHQELRRFKSRSTFWRSCSSQKFFMDTE